MMNDNNKNTSAVDYSKVAIIGLILIFTAFITAWFNQPSFICLAGACLLVKNQRMIVKEVITTYKEPSNTK